MAGFRDFFLKREDRTYPVTSVPGTNEHRRVRADRVTRPAIDSGLDRPPPARPARKEVVFFLAPDYNMEDTLLFGKVKIKRRVGLPGGGMLEWDERFNIYRPVAGTYGDRFELQ